MNLKKIESVIKAYRIFRTQHPDTWIDYTMQQNSLEKAIEAAALSVDAHGKRNPHQRRRSSQTLSDFRDALVEKKAYFGKAKHFDELFSLVDSVRVHDIGPLTKYDAAHRIGCYRKLLPDKVYLHNGALLGAEYLLKTRIRERSISKLQLPSPFHSEDVSCADIEDILCIYKDRLREAAGNI